LGDGGLAMGVLATVVGGLDAVGRYRGHAGCQPWLKVRSKAEKQRRAENCEALSDLCRSLYQRYGPRTHIFGNCWERAIEELAPFASSDTSHWMTPKRSGCMVFRHDNSHLAKAPARVLSEA
jgi:hypothetical protein